MNARLPSDSIGGSLFAQKNAWVFMKNAMLFCVLLDNMIWI